MGGPTHEERAAAGGAAATTAGGTAVQGRERYAYVSHSPGADIRGGHGKMQLRRDTFTGQMVAVKLQRSDKREAFHEEICGKAFRAMHHPNIDRLLDEFIEGKYIGHVHALADTTLYHYLTNIHFAYVPFGEANKIAGQIAAGLSFLHGLEGGPVTHGDLSDKNILLVGDHLDVCRGSHVTLTLGHVGAILRAL